ncbi:DUF4044 domain-containing protein [Streptococcus moroccensis]|uniref:DUF4044 domain-containing protein n=1 Tax=Streptococcus moroccensis TaxID=1451356 RepID=A0ABT9YPK0_9STRE|nr:DUF4044 domain-containing protein [Streptococcus moroccensis]MDQ0221923.1 hypothetical protein [Streptococcus moroccensis]
MAFGEQKKKKTPFEILTLLVVLVMLVAMVFGVIVSAISVLTR